MQNPAKTIVLKGKNNVASLVDIREWGAAHGFDVTDGKRLPTGLRAAYDEAHNSEDQTEQWQQPTLDESEDAGERAPVVEGVDIAPVKAARSLVDKVRSRAGASQRKTPVRKSKPKKPRVSVEKFVSRLWGFLADAAKPINPPMARVLDVQAPVAGMILEDTVRDTLADKLLQPLARAEGHGETIFALVGPPLLVGAIQARPEAAPVLVPLLKESLRVWVDVAGDKIETARKRDEEFQDRYGQTIDQLIAYIFDMPQEEAKPE